MTNAYLEVNQVVSQNNQIFTQTEEIEAQTTNIFGAMLGVIYSAAENQLNADVNQINSDINSSSKSANNEVPYDQAKYNNDSQSWSTLEGTYQGFVSAGQQVVNTLAQALNALNNFASTVNQGSAYTSSLLSGSLA